jgi:preprotein translocase subunit YajC
MNQQMVVFLPLLIVLGAFMFFASRRQKRAMQATLDLHDSLRVGDRVHTTSGLQGTIKRITDDTVDLEIAAGVVTTWMKLAIRDRIEPEVLDTEAQEADGLCRTTRSDCPKTRAGGPPRTLCGAVELIGARKASG